MVLYVEVLVSYVAVIVVCIIVGDVAVVSKVFIEGVIFKAVEGYEVVPFTNYTITSCPGCG